MKKLCLHLIATCTLTLGLVSFALPQFVHADILSNLVAHWKFDEGSGTSASDATGNGNTGTLQNSATWNSSAKIGPYAVSLVAASSQYVSVPAPNWSGTNFTMTAWINSSANQSSYVGVLYSRAMTNPSGWGLSYGPAGGTVNQLGYTFKVADEWQWNSGLIVPNSQWVFVAWVASSSSVTMYMGTSGGGLQSATHVEAETSLTWNGQFEVGRDSLSSRYFNGSVDDVCVYTRALAPADITDLYNSTSVGCTTSASASTPDYSSLFFKLY